MNQAYEPLEQVRQTFKVDWYRSPIAKDQLKELTQRSDLRGVAQALGSLPASPAPVLALHVQCARFLARAEIHGLAGIHV